MTTTWLRGQYACASTVRDAKAPAWPNLTDLDAAGRLKRDCAWSLADARRHCEGKPAPRTLRGGIEYAPDPLAPTMTHPMGQVSLLR